METHWKQPISRYKKIERTQQVVRRQIKRILFIINNVINNKERDITLKQKIDIRPHRTHVTLLVNNVEIAEDNFYTKKANKSALHAVKPVINAKKYL